MSANSSIKTPLKNIKSAVASTKTRDASAKQQLFHSQFVPTPNPLNNPVNYAVTQSIATDPSHPFCIRTQRRLAAFNPDILHWTVKAPVELSKKVIVRKWVARRFKEAFRLELERSGWTKDGQAIDQDGTQSLKGALCVYLSKDAAIVKADWEHVRKECEGLVRKIVRLQKEESMRPATEKNATRNELKKRKSLPAKETNTTTTSLKHSISIRPRQRRPRRSSNARESQEHQRSSSQRPPVVSHRPLHKGMHRPRSLTVTTLDKFRPALRSKRSGPRSTRSKRFESRSDQSAQPFVE